MPHNSTPPEASPPLAESPLAEWAALIEHFTGRDGEHATAISDLTLFRSSLPTQPSHGLHELALCAIAQGSKIVIQGDELLNYDGPRFLLGAVDLPYTAHITQATPERPYLSLSLRLDPAQINALLGTLTSDDSPASSAAKAPARGLSVGRFDAPLLDAVTRLLRLLERPQHIRALAPLVKSEIAFLLLTSEQSARMRLIAAQSDGTWGIGAAIHWLKDNYAQPLRIEEIAERAHLSQSGFYQQFKAVTAMSPVQYQKQLRLQEARRLMLSEEADATTASLRVGYESTSQFSREYRRLFGESPRRDIARLREGDSRSQETE